MFSKPRFARRAMWRLLVLPIVLLALGLFFVPSARAFESRSGENVVIGPDEVIDDDLYVFAMTLDLQGTVDGDLVFFGQAATIDGRVTGDLIAAGQQIVISGEVGDDARVAGYAIELSGQLGDDLIAAGFSLDNAAGSAVGGDLVFAGYQALLAGEVSGKANVNGGAVDIEGTIAGDATVDVGGSEPSPGGQRPPMFAFPGTPVVPSVPPGLTVGDGASIGGDLSYTANQRADIPAGAVSGAVNFSQYVPQQKQEARPSPALAVLRWFLHQLRRLITLLLIGALMLWWLPGWTRALETVVRSKPWPSLGWGFVALIAFGVAMMVLVIVTALLAIVFGVVTLGGLAGRFVELGLVTFGVASFSFSVAWVYITRIVISLLFGHLIFRLFGSRDMGRLWWPMIVGVLIFVLITAIPILGWLLGFLAALFGLGALWIWARERLRERRPAPVEAPAAPGMEG
jgi:cytoskeletal protein CcmA (bactofilin family)